MKVKGNHPIAEIIAKKLSGIEMVLLSTAKRRMLNQACMAATDYCEQREQGVEILKSMLKYSDERYAALKADVMGLECEREIVAETGCVLWHKDVTRRYCQICKLKQKWGGK